MLLFGVVDLPRPAEEMDVSELADLVLVKLGERDLLCGCLDFVFVAPAAAVAAAGADGDLPLLYTVSFVMSCLRW